MKRFFALLLSLLTVLSLVSCGKERDKESHVTWEPDIVVDLLISMTDIGLEYYERREPTMEKLSQLVRIKTEGLVYESAVLVEPAMWPNPFALLVFKLPKDADADAFARMLKENAIPNWQVCVGAKAVETAVFGQIVIFYMCSEASAVSLGAAIEKMKQEDFDPNVYLANPLEGKTASEIYSAIKKRAGDRLYLDGDIGELTASGLYGFSEFFSMAVNGIVDTGEEKDDYFDDDNRYLFAILRLKEPKKASRVVDRLCEMTEPADACGETWCAVSAYRDDIVIFYIGSGMSRYRASTLAELLVNVYQMECVTFDQSRTAYERKSPRRNLDSGGF